MATTSRNRSRANSSATAEAEFTLDKVIEATKQNGGQGFLYTPASFHDPLIAKGDVITNPAMVDEAGNVATRATAKHLEQSQESNTVSDTQANPKFEIETGVAIPARKPRSVSHLNAGRTAVYPFASLQIGESFFVPDPVDAEGNPVKTKNGKAIKTAYNSLSSTVSQANENARKYVEGTTRVKVRGKGAGTEGEDFIELKKFKHFDTERTLPDGSIQKGARIFRVEPEKKTLEDGTIPA